MECYPPPPGTKTKNVIIQFGVNGSQYLVYIDEGFKTPNVKIFLHVFPSTRTVDSIYIIQFYPPLGKFESTPVHIAI